MRIRLLLKKCTAATLFAVMMVAGIGTSILDAHGVGEQPHFDAPGQAGCSPYDHNHSLCIFMTASPHLATTPPSLVAHAPPVTVVATQDADISIEAGASGVVRSRSPPAV
jgi:hypothetical protein